MTTLSVIGARLIIVGDPFTEFASLLAGTGIGVVTVAELQAGVAADAPRVDRGNADPALLQLTSGSTATPKAVRITHGNLWANIEAMCATARLRAEDDVMVSWLPLFHDMGMVGFLTLPMCRGIELVTVTPPDFLAKPLLWPELISKYRGTVTAAPNFAYAIVGRRMSKVDDDNAYDLSKLRIALNGAEPVDKVAVATFTDDLPRADELMTALERRADVLQMLRSSLAERSVFLWIGDENPQPELRSVSVIGANYGLGHRNLGAVGVVGPLRMDYATAIASVRVAARELSRYFETVYDG